MLRKHHAPAKLFALFLCAAFLSGRSDAQPLRALTQEDLVFKKTFESSRGFFEDSLLIMDSLKDQDGALNIRYAQFALRICDPQNELSAEERRDFELSAKEWLGSADVIEAFFKRMDTLESHLIEQRQSPNKATRQELVLKESLEAFYGYLQTKLFEHPECQWHKRAMQMPKTLFADPLILLSLPIPTATDEAYENENTADDSDTAKITAATPEAEERSAAELQRQVRTDPLNNYGYLGARYLLEKKRKPIDLGNHVVFERLQNKAWELYYTRASREFAANGLSVYLASNTEPANIYFDFDNLENFFNPDFVRGWKAYWTHTLERIQAENTAR